MRTQPDADKDNMPIQQDRTFTLQEICNSCKMKEFYLQSIIDADAESNKKITQTRLICSECNEATVFDTENIILYRVEFRCKKCSKVTRA